jgi:pyridoxine 5-phosphate synthase
MPRLCLCVNQIARIRNLYKTHEPDPVDIAIAAEIAGVDGIVAQLKDDRSDITDRDVDVLKQVVKSHFNLAVALNEELIKKAIKVLPDMITLMNSGSESLHTTNALDVNANYEYVEDTTAALRANNIVVSVFIEPEGKQIKAAARAEVDYVQLDTSPLAKIEDLKTLSEYIEKLKSNAIAANKLGLGVSAGGGLNFQNVGEFGDMSFIEEINIGKALISRALLVGIDQSVRRMLSLIR